MSKKPKCQCCKVRAQTRTLFKNGKPLRLCDFCDTQKPPAPKKIKPPAPPGPLKRFTRSR